MRALTAGLHSSLLKRLSLNLELSNLTISLARKLLRQVEQIWAKKPRPK